MLKKKSAIFYFLIKEWKLELRNNFIFWSSVIYIFAIGFLIYILLNRPDDSVWNSLFWLTQIFIIINVVSKSFLSENKKRMSFFFCLISPQQFILSKIIYHILLSVAYVLLSLLIFLFFLGKPNFSIVHYFFLATFASIGFSIIFTFMSAIGAKAQQNSALIAILGFPLLIPQLMLIDKLSNSIFDPQNNESILSVMGILILFDTLTIALSVILYPFLWKE